MQGPLAGSAALVTGGGSGIGFACAERLVADGLHVTICGRTAAKLDDAVARISAASPTSSGSVRSVVADVTAEADVIAAVRVATERDGRLAVLVASAGGSAHVGPLVEADIVSVRTTIDVNLVGTLLCIKHAVEPMRANGGGAIVCISSGAGHFPHRWLSAYGASKAGIDMLTRSAAEELGHEFIRVNSVQPGIVDDELMAPITVGGALHDDYIANMPLGRLGQVQDVAAAVRFLVGPESSWITGVTLPLDGGHHLRRGADYSRLLA